MPKITKEQKFFNDLRDFSNQFLNMTEEERIECIKRYPVLQSYQRHVLRQLKTIMSKKEKAVYREVLNKEKQKNENVPQPQ